MSLLDRLNSEFLDRAAFGISTADGLRRFLAHQADVIEVRRGMSSGAITEDDVHRFVRELLSDFRTGRTFSGDLALSALAVALETFPASFAEHFLTDLSGVRAAELPLAPRISTLALRERRNLLPALTIREIEISAPVPERWGPPVEWSPICVAAGLIDRRYQVAW